MGEVRHPKAFLRWVGGKARRARILADRLASFESAGTYFEPFLGGASVFFAFAPRNAVIADANADLMCVYRHTQADPEALWDRLASLTSRVSRSDYKTIRAAYNGMSCSVDKAAHFIYLNRMCFNGIYRVNKSGEFNVPFGGRPNPGFPDLSELEACAGALQKARLITADFDAALRSARRGDVVFLDPPYLPLNGTSFFRHYTKERFSIEDHQRLAATALRLAEAGVDVMVTVGDLPETRDMYDGMNLEPLSVRHYVGSNGDRKTVGELLITSSGGQSSG